MPVALPAYGNGAVQRGLFVARVVRLIKCEVLVGCVSGGQVGMDPWHE